MIEFLPANSENTLGNYKFYKFYKKVQGNGKAIAESLCIDF